MIPSTTFERITYLGWFFADLQCVVVAILVERSRNRMKVAINVSLSNLFVFALHWLLSLSYPDHNVTATFTGHFLDILHCWGSIRDLLQSKNTRGHSIEIWKVIVFSAKVLLRWRNRLMRFLGNIFCLCVFIWRYVNVPENWVYVRSPWHILIVSGSYVSNIVYPFVYFHVITHKAKDL